MLGGSSVCGASCKESSGWYSRSVKRIAPTPLVVMRASTPAGLACEAIRNRTLTVCVDLRIFTADAVAARFIGEQKTVGCVSGDAPPPGGRRSKLDRVSAFGA
jgi:hypothetical protein